MKEGQLYEIKATTMIELGSTSSLEGAPDHPVLKGWKKWDYHEIREPLIYLGYKRENWMYNYQNTNKIHYVLWKGDMCVMDNQFAKHIVPVWEKNDGQD